MTGKEMVAWTPRNLLTDIELVLAPALAGNTVLIFKQLVLLRRVRTVLVTEDVDIFNSTPLLTIPWMVVVGKLRRLTRIFAVRIVTVTLTWLPTTRGTRHPLAIRPMVIVRPQNLNEDNLPLWSRTTA